MFYLDAHWYESLPLQEELDTILDSWPQSCILIDDFAVPWDAEYGFDDYGQGKTLSLDLIVPTIQRHAIEVFFPTIPAAKETGGRRGYVFLIPSDISDSIEDVAGLKRFC